MIDGFVKSKPDETVISSIARNLYVINKFVSLRLLPSVEMTTLSDFLQDWQKKINTKNSSPANLLIQKT